MEKEVVSKTSIVKAMVLAVVILLIIFLANFFDKRTKIVFCDVGQGDAAYIRVKNKIDVLIDAGPDRKVLSCLGKYMPFYDRKIELAILSHPQKDHYGGFDYVLDRYQIDKFLMTSVDNDTQSFKRLKQKMSNKKIKTGFPTARTSFSFLNDSLRFYWPTEEFIAQNVMLSNNNTLGATNLDFNNFSFVLGFEENQFRVLFTGDASSFVLNQLLQQSIKDIQILKIPHHGSKSGLSKKFLELANPRVGVISVGKNNPYGHPTKEVLEMLKALNVKVRRTDTEGNIVFKISNIKN